MTTTATMDNQVSRDAQAAVEPPPESAWLVEWQAHGYGPQWFGFNYAPDARWDWCADANKAVRFARQEDAERMRLHILAASGRAGNLDYANSISATEHEWLTGAGARRVGDCVATCGADMREALKRAEWQEEMRDDAFGPKA